MTPVSTLRLTLRVGDLLVSVPGTRVWKELAFALRFCDRQIRVQLTHAEERYLVDEGAPLKVTIRGEPHLLSPGTPAVIRRSPP